jgi:arsenite methyltransferase
VLDLARTNAAEAAAMNVEFPCGHIDAIPLPDGSVDVVVSDCVLNLSVDNRPCSPSSPACCDPAGVSESPTSATTVGAISGVLTTAEYRAQLGRADLTDVTVTAHPRGRAHRHLGDLIAM